MAVAAGIVALAGGGGSRLGSWERLLAMIGIAAGLSYVGYAAMLISGVL